MTTVATVATPTASALHDRPDVEGYVCDAYERGFHAMTSAHHTQRHVDILYSKRSDWGMAFRDYLICFTNKRERNPVK